MFGWISKAWHWATSNIPGDIVNWVHDLVRGLYFFLNIIFGAVGGAWSNLKDIADYFGAKLEHYLDEAFRAVKDAYDWINKEGYLVYYYITHPEKLVLLLWDALIANLEATAWDTAGKLGKFFLSLILKNRRRFIDLIEDILHAVL